MKTRDAHPLGIAWVTIVFLSIPMMLYFVDYNLEPRWIRGFLVAVASGLSTFSIMAVMFWVNQLTNVRFSSEWYTTRKGETARLYRLLGVERFRRWLLKSPFRSLNQDVHVRGASEEDLVTARGYMDSAEANHVIGFAVTVLLTDLYAIGHSTDFLVWFAFFNVVGNVYPILLQRMNRLRIDRLLARLAGRRGREVASPRAHLSSDGAR